jgi:long-chain acyl-CoA synthetase
MTNSQTLGPSILQMRHRDPSHVAVQYKVKDEWVSKSWPDYYTEVERLGAALLSYGIKAGDRIGIMANTCFAWSVADLAVMGIQAVVVPIYQNNTVEDVEYILNDSATRLVFCDSKAALKTLESVRARCPALQQLVLMDDHPVDSDAMTWSTFHALGKMHLEDFPNCYVEICNTLKSTDFATLLYTSGTTGLPKGVVLTHLQAYSEVAESFPLCGVNEKDVSLSFLPYAHILGRLEHWGHLLIGYNMAYAESIEKIRGNLIDIRPTILVSVPRIFEKVYAAIWAQVQSSLVKSKLFKWALGIGEQVGAYKMSGEILPLDLLAQYEVAKKLVLKNISDAFGGRLRFAISGGAPISKEIVSFFHSAGVLILEGYGMTETTGAITVNTPFNYRFGSVGRPIGEVRLKIAEDGEILVKSDKVMKEYYKNPQATSEAFIDGWFHTGDIGEILPSGDLKITDRKKDLIKTAGGKYVAPQRLEGLLKLSPAIAQVLIHGDQRKYIVALLTLDKVFVEKYAKEKGILAKSWEELVQKPGIQELIREVVAETNSQLASYESIKKFQILPDEWTIEAGELTPSLKVKRKVLDEKYRQKIEDLY